MKKIWLYCTTSARIFILEMLGYVVICSSYLELLRRDFNTYAPYGSYIMLLVFFSFCRIDIVLKFGGFLKDIKKEILAATGKTIKEWRQIQKRLGISEAELVHIISLKWGKYRKSMPYTPRTTVHHVILRNNITRNRSYRSPSRSTSTRNAKSSSTDSSEGSESDCSDPPNQSSLHLVSPLHFPLLNIQSIIQSMPCATSTLFTYQSKGGR